MKLQRALKSHETSRAKLGLKNAFGDSFLLENNPVFRRSRELTNAAGYRFVPAWEAYRRASLFELPYILKAKTIPYNDTVPTLKRLVRDHALDDEMEDVPVDLTSYHFHESAHCISDAVFSVINARTKNERILIALLCESYANASESFAVGFVDSNTHQFFFEQNSYLYATPERAKSRRDAVEAWGLTAFFRLLWMTYLYSNFVVYNLPEEELREVVSFALGKGKLTNGDLRRALAFFHDAQELNLGFRLKSAGLYMRMVGIKGEVEKNLAFNFLALFARRLDLVEAFNQLATDTSNWT